MKMKKTMKHLCLAMTLCASPLATVAQEFHLSYTTEIQSDFQDKSNWLNHLRMDFSMPIIKNVSFNASTLSISQTNGSPIMRDMLTFSNIEAEETPLAPAVLGFSWQAGNSELFLGVHNMDESFFGTACNSLFTNSSCGMFPTMAANYTFATYPLAAMGIAYTLRLDGWTFQTSLYNGVGHNKFSGSDNVFRICPESDGYLSATQIAYEHGGSAYYLGMFHRDAPLPAAGEDGTESSPKSFQSAYWAYAEQKLCDRLHLLAHYSFNPSVDNGYRSYIGGGLTAHIGKTEGGVFVQYADMKPDHEWAAELTWKIPVFDNGYIQPALHYFNNSATEDVAGLLRFGYEL